SPSLGLINPFLKAIGLTGLAGDFLGNPNRVLLVMIVIDTWHGFGLYMFIFISRLVGIQQELHDAAFVDGANFIKDIWYITLPLLKSTVALVFLLEAMDSLKIFGTIYVMTKGGPLNSTLTLVYLIYEQGLYKFNFGYASAIAYCLFFIIMVFSFLQMKAFGLGRGIED
ncbi:MAG: sugar ABC transporter permease, partial [candidate division Zixibacteria bacterium]|nr:sugar ABC transporter permease [candidate division Zixibacteria bacterium]